MPMSIHQPLHLIALCSGEPAGIGPDLCLMQALNYEDELATHQKIILLGDPLLLAKRAQLLGLDLNITEVDDSYYFDSTQPQKNNCLFVKAIHCPAPVNVGTLNTRNSQYVIDILDEAISGCLSGKYKAMVTAPVQKSVIHQAGIPFTGHTEYLAEKTNTAKVVMMLASPSLKVTLATTHLPLRDVADAITQESLTDIIHIIQRDLKQYFGLTKPKLLVCGLNPHAGEDGLLGHEEAEIITPCLNKLRAEDIDLIGPLPADMLFTEKVLSQGDAVLAMYHDQGLPVLKHQGFGQSANITLGLPIIRTSVDHGTALDLAGTGTVNLGSLHTATQMAFLMTASRQST